MLKEDIETVKNATDFIQSTVVESEKGANISTKLTCIGVLCGGAEFDSTEPGCAPLLHYCAKCNEAIRAELSGSIHLRAGESTSHLSTISEGVHSDEDNEFLHDNEEYKSPKNPKQSPAKKERASVSDKYSSPSSQKDAADEEPNKEREAEDAEMTSKGDELEARKRDESKQSCAHVHNLFHAIAERHGSDEAATIILQNTPRRYVPVSKAVTGARRHLFVLKDVELEDLYWYEEYAAYLSRSKFYVSMCKMDNGDVVLAILMTRCPRSRCDLMIHSLADNKVHIVKEAEYCQTHPGVKLDPDEPIDEAKYQALRKAYIVKSRMIFDPERGLPISSKKYSMSDYDLQKIGALTGCNELLPPRTRKQPERLTPEKQRAPAHSQSMKRHAASVRKQQKARKKARVAAKQPKAKEEDEEEEEWEDDDSECEDDRNPTQKSTRSRENPAQKSTSRRHDSEETVTLIEQLKALLDSSHAVPHSSTSQTVAEGAAPVADVVLGNKKVTPASIQLMVDTQLEMARLQEQTRKYHLAQQLLILLS